jgi:hypothetical protein
VDLVAVHRFRRCAFSSSRRVVREGRTQTLAVRRPRRIRDLPRRCACAGLGFELSGSTPSARAWATSAVLGEFVLLWGGVGAAGFLGDLHLLDTRAKRWYNLFQSTSSPSPRASAAFALVGSTLWMHGGLEHTGGVVRPSDELWMLETFLPVPDQSDEEESSEDEDEEDDEEDAENMHDPNRWPTAFVLSVSEEVASAGSVTLAAPTGQERDRWIGALVRDVQALSAELAASSVVPPCTPTAPEATHGRFRSVSTPSHAGALGALGSGIGAHHPSSGSTGGGLVLGSSGLGGLASLGFGAGSVGGGASILSTPAASALRFATSVPASSALALHATTTNNFLPLVSEEAEN